MRFAAARMCHGNLAKDARIGIECVRTSAIQFESLLRADMRPIWRTSKIKIGSAATAAAAAVAAENEIKSQARLQFRTILRRCVMRVIFKQNTRHIVCGA